MRLEKFLKNRLLAVTKLIKMKPIWKQWWYVVLVVGFFEFLKRSLLK